MAARREAEGSRELVWMGSTKKDLMTCPEDVVDAFGHALELAQRGETYSDAKPLVGDKAFKGAKVMEVVERSVDGTYRAVYTAKLETAVYVLHVFQKKSKSGIATPQADIDLIKRRLKDASTLDQQRLQQARSEKP